jgi:methanophenazine hydrogenase, cytochrome b subunit
MQGNQNFDNDVVIGNRYRLRDMIAHQSHMITCVLLLITGLYMAIQFNTCSLHAWELMSYQTLRLIHVIAGILFLVINWSFIPFNLITSGHLLNDLFGLKDFTRLYQAIVGVFKPPEEYPKYTIYDKTTGHYKNKLHPGYKLMVVFEAMAILFIGLTGIIMIDLKFGFMNFDIPVWNNFMAWFVNDITGSAAAVIGMSGVQLIRTIHLWATYWFVLELIIHLGFLGTDPRMSQNVKALFITGKETMNEYVEVVEGAHEEHKKKPREKRPLIVFR